MADITITVPDNQVDRVCTAIGWSAELGVTRAVYAKAWIRQQLIAAIKAHEAASAAVVARDAATAAVDSEVQIT